MMRIGGVQLRVFATGFSLLFIFIAAAVPPAVAGLLVGDPNAYVSGTVPLVATDNIVFGTVEYAAYRPGDFQLSFPGEDTPNLGVTTDPGGGFDPAGEWVYAYQVYDNGAKSTGTSRFSAGVGDVGPGNPLPATQGYGDGDNDNEEVNSGDGDYVPGSGTNPLKVPNLIQVTSTSVVFNFTGTSALKNEWSPVLFYTSKFIPGWDNGSTTPTLRNEGFGNGVRVPSPEIPEPSSIALASLALVWLAMSGWRRGI